MGAWSFIQPRMNSLVRQYFGSWKIDVSYAGRPPSSAAATGYKSIHDEELANLLKKAFE